MKQHFIIGILLLAAGLSSCEKDAAGDAAPVVSNLNISPNTVRSGFSEDTVIITFTVDDANGDLGNDPFKKEFDVYAKDSRDNNETGFPFPDMPDEITEDGKSITAIVTIKLNAGLFLHARQDRPDGDTLTYDIYVKDKKGNKSNIVTTPEIYIVP